MTRIISKRGKSSAPPSTKPGISIDSEGNWTFSTDGKKKWPFPTGRGSRPVPNDPSDEEVLRRTTGGIVDINYIQTEDC